jgi:hypothetical protein
MATRLDRQRPRGLIRRNEVYFDRTALLAAERPR